MGTTSMLCNLNKHYRADHPESLKCDSCQYTNGRRKQVIAHINMVHKGIKPYKCHVCSIEVALKGNLLKHIRRHHVKDMIKCPECSYTNTGMYEIKRHFRFKHLEIIDFQCHLCGRATLTNEKLQRHIKAVHEKVKDQLCDMCSAKFASRFNLKAHIKSVHLKVKDFKCSSCSYETDRNTKLKYHILKNHSNIQIASNLSILQTSPTKAPNASSENFSAELITSNQLDGWP